MNCESVRDYFSDLVDGTIDQALNITIESHFKTCRACAEEYEGFRHAWDLLESIPWVETPPQLHGRVMAALRDLKAQESRAPKSAWRTWLDKLTQPVPQRPVVGWSAAALAAVVLFGIAVRVGPGDIAMWVSPSVPVRQIAPIEKLNSVQVLPEVVASGENGDTISIGVKTRRTDVRVKCYVLENRRTSQWQPWLLSSLTPANGLTLEGSVDATHSPATQKLFSVTLPRSEQPAVNVVLVKLSSGGASRYLALFVPTHRSLEAVPCDVRVSEPLSSAVYTVALRHQKIIMIEGATDAMVRLPNPSDSTLEALETFGIQSGLVLDVLPNGIYTLTRR